MMNETEFVAAAEQVLGRIEQAVETAGDQAGIDIDIELMPDGVLKLEFENGSQMIINRHVAAREIWVAARSGGFHFRPEGDAWVGTRDGKELWAALAALVSEQAEEALILKA
jgi:CyaY protein